jgi:hypothetical protein
MENYRFIKEQDTDSEISHTNHIYNKFCYDVYNQCESFICLDLMFKNIEIPIEMYFKW